MPLPGAILGAHSKGWLGLERPPANSSGQRAEAAAFADVGLCPTPKGDTAGAEVASALNRWAADMSFLTGQGRRTPRDMKLSCEHPMPGPFPDTQTRLTSHSSSCPCGHSLRDSPAAAGTWRQRGDPADKGTWDSSPLPMPRNPQQTPCGAAPPRPPSLPGKRLGESCTHL